MPVLMNPCAVSTPVMTPFSRLTPSTLQFSMIRAPAMRAPLASDSVMSDGFACPSVGR